MGYFFFSVVKDKTHVFALVDHVVFQWVTPLSPSRRYSIGHRAQPRLLGAAQAVGVGYRGGVGDCSYSRELH